MRLTVTMPVAIEVTNDKRSARRTSCDLVSCSMFIPLEVGRGSTVYFLPCSIMAHNCDLYKILVYTIVRYF